MNVFIRQQQDVYQWFSTLDTAVSADKETGSLEQLAAFYQENSSFKNWIFIAPAIDVANRTIEYSAKEKKHIIKAIPFLLEEDLLTEADDMHVVMAAAADKANAMDVVAIEGDLLQRWLDTFNDAGVKITHCIAESLFLPESDAQWQIFYRDDVFIIRAHTGESVAVDARHIALSLQMLSDDYASMPSSVELITESDEAQEQAMKLMPVAVAPLINAIQIDYADMLSNQFSGVAKAWNLLTGQYAVAREWLAMVKPWRWVAASLAAVFILNVALTMSELSAQKERSAYLRTEMDKVFRQVIPRGNIVDHRKQLQRHLKSATASGSGEPFIAKMDKIGAVLNKHQVQTLNSLNYDLDKSELRLDFLVKDYDQLQAILSALKASGLNAEIQNSNAQGDQLRTRLRITG
ncbi:MAG: hypothetical protein HRU20_18145 [Pseudomonadales bacterium]|nr:hypothetical protein [Pseudomonadales bacterium]